MYPNHIKFNNHKQILNFNQVFKVSQKIGEGSFGSVFKITDNLSGKNYALKIIKKVDEVTIKEVNMLAYTSQLSSINKDIVHYYDYFYYFNYFCILMEYVEGITIFKYFSIKRPLNQWIKFAKWLLLTVNKLHQLNIIHRDIKPDNIIIYKNTYKLIDFGLSCQLNSRNPNLKCKLEKVWPKIFTAPEIWSNVNLNYYKGNDNYACGMTLYYIYTLKLPYTYNNNGDIISPIYHPLYSFKYNSILHGLLMLNPRKRFTVNYALTLLNNT